MWHTYKKTFLERDRDARNVGGGLGILPPPPLPRLFPRRGLRRELKRAYTPRPYKNCGVPN